jgi:hypothetical protein
MAAASPRGAAAFLSISLVQRNLINLRKRLSF